MATSVYKGSIKAGTIRAVFKSDFSNSSTDLLTISYADVNGGNAQADHAAVAPGGSGEVGVNAPEKGLLEVFVVAANDKESGRLSVERAAKSRKAAEGEPVVGSVRWVYTVLP